MVSTCGNGYSGLVGSFVRLAAVAGGGVWEWLVVLKRSIVASHTWCSKLLPCCYLFAYGCSNVLTVTGSRSRRRTIEIISGEREGDRGWSGLSGKRFNEILIRNYEWIELASNRITSGSSAALSMGIRFAALLPRPPPPPQSPVGCRRAIVIPAPSANALL